jgi:predicted RNA-binding protein associated with RNAse of E/G family
VVLQHYAPGSAGPADDPCDDLALDVYIAPDGAITVLDEDEFATLPLDEATRACARAALAELQHRIVARQPPFDALD